MQGVLSGLIACVLALIGIFTFGIPFIPLALIVALVSFIRGLSCRSVGGFGVSILAFVLCGVGFVVSPTLWIATAALIGIEAAPPPQPAPAQSSGTVMQQPVSGSAIRSE